MTLPADIFAVAWKRWNRGDPSDILALAARAGDAPEADRPLASRPSGRPSMSGPTSARGMQLKPSRCSRTGPGT